MKRSIQLLALTLLGAGSALAQDESERPEIGIEDLVPGAAGQADPREEMTKLFQSVERRLKDMGGYLLDAGAGDTSKIAKLDATGIEDLLRQGRPEAPQPTGGVGDLLSISKAEGERVLEDIEKILQLAQQNGGT
ncbi:MAG: hypothetical protein O2816_13100 [Planctomycetota bacterium]|nr:hypothetical protein [Planctomycetota bacterium]